MQIIITGVSQGLGFELFNILKMTPHTLTALSSSFQDEQYDFAKTHSNIELIPINLSNLDALQHILNTISFENNIIFINNAATIYPINTLRNITEKQIISAFNVNVIAPILITKKLIERSLSIIHIGSAASKQAIDNWSLYCSTKAGMSMFFDVIAKENIDIINIDPGVMNTKMQQIIRNSEFDELSIFKSFFENKELRDPKDVALAIFEQYIKKRIEI